MWPFCQGGTVYQLTLNCENTAAARTAGIVEHLTGIEPRILECCREQLQACAQVHKRYLNVVSIADLLIIFVPADIQGLRTAEPAFKAVPFARFYKGSGRKFLDKLRWFCKVK